ncbi:SDR family oxidoreductase, partial [Acinetobacter baumannii]
YDGLKRAIPLKRLGQPEDVPGIIAFLSSDDANFMTGQVISVSGGLTMNG